MSVVSLILIDKLSLKMISFKTNSKSPTFKSNFKNQGKINQILSITLPQNKFKSQNSFKTTLSRNPPSSRPKIITFRINRLNLKSTLRTINKTTLLKANI